MGKMKKFMQHIVKAGVSQIPVVGSIVNEMIDFFTDNIKEKKEKMFFQGVERRLSECEADIKQMKTNEFGFCMFAKAYRMWQVEAENDKLEYYVNMVKNGYFSSISNTKKILFSSKLSEYSMEQLEMLLYFSKDHFIDESTPSKQICYSDEKMIDVIYRELPKYNDEKELLCYIVNTLIKDSFVKPFQFEMPLQKEKACGKWTTKLGDEFLQFINDACGNEKLENIS